jgi:peptidylprolyl isomerase
MKRTILFSASLLISLFSSLNGEESKTNTTTSSNDSQQPEIAKISEAFGHLIGKNLESLGFQFDMQAVVQGLKDASVGKSSPMSEVECIQAITSIQEAAYKEQSQVNLAKAEEFLKKNKKGKNIVSLEKGKVQYKVEKEGLGNSIQPNLTPVIRYVGKFLDGSVFGQSQEDEPISLDEMIPGLKQGMLGMKEGEKRTIYIHPEMAYGTKGTLPPNSLLTFEIEVIKADAAPQAEKSDYSNTIKEKTPEIAFPVQVEEAIR